MKKKIEEYIWNGHINRTTSLPKKSFDTFDDALGFINLKDLKGVCPYLCEVCGKYHYGHPFFKERSQILPLKKLLEEKSRELSGLQRELSEKDLTERSLKDSLENLQAENRYLREALEKKGVFQDSLIKYYKKDIPKKIEGYKLKLETEKYGRWVLSYVSPEGDVKFQTSPRSSRFEVYQELWLLWKKLKEVP